MRLIKPSEISGKVMTIIDEAVQRLVIVSPYNRFRGWKRLEMLLSRAIDIVPDFQYFTRHDNETGNAFLDDIGITPILVPNLHAKLYFNERSGVVTSMNLLRSSEDASLEIGFETESSSELGYFHEFYDLYLRRYVDNPLDIPEMDLPDDIEDIYEATAYYIDRGIQDSIADPVPISYEKRRDAARYRIGRKDFEAVWDFHNKTLRFICRMILSGDCYDYLASRITDRMDGLPVAAILESGDDRHYSFYEVVCPLPERKLRECSRLQISKAARATALGMLLPLIELATSTDVSVRREIIA